MNKNKDGKEREKEEKRWKFEKSAMNRAKNRRYRDNNDVDRKESTVFTGYVEGKKLKKRI